MNQAPMINRSKGRLIETGDILKKQFSQNREMGHGIIMKVETTIIVTVYHNRLSGFFVMGQREEHIPELQTYDTETFVEPLYEKYDHYEHIGGIYNY